jgi:hypothetical protein
MISVCFSVVELSAAKAIPGGTIFTLPVTVRLTVDDPVPAGFATLPIDVIVHVFVDAS